MYELKWYVKSNQIKSSSNVLTVFNLVFLARVYSREDRVDRHQLRWQSAMSWSHLQETYRDLTHPGWWKCFPQGKLLLLSKETLLILATCLTPSRRHENQNVSRVCCLGNGMGFWICCHLWLSSPSHLLQLAFSVGAFTMFSMHIKH